MGQTFKTPKGEISITKCEERIRLRWRYNGNRYSLNLPFVFSEENMHQATLKVAEIKLDILKRCFDTSLEKYKPVIDQVILKTTEQALVQETKSIAFLNDLVPKFNEWCKNIRNIDVDNSIDFLYIRKSLEKWEGVPVNDVSEKLNNGKLAVSTYNKRLAYLSLFFSWLTTLGILERNPLQDVCKRKNKGKKKNQQRVPMEEKEILSFLDAIKNDTYCSNSSTYKHSFYHSFLKFIFYTGVRNAEAIGLRVKHVNIQEKQVEISETLARTVNGSNHAARIRKGTKMENIRFLPLNEDLIDILGKQIIGKSPDDLVFQSVRGLSIDDRMLQRRIIKPVLQKLGFGNKDLYSARHAFGTRAVQQGMALTDVAYLMGHSSIETASRNYVHVERAAKVLPELKL